MDSWRPWHVILLVFAIGIGYAGFVYGLALLDEYFMIKP